MTDKKPEETNKKKFYTGEAIMFLGAYIILTWSCWMLINKREARYVKRVNEQVEVYENALPADYQEYKQTVEHYRDSLMRANGRENVITR